MINIRTTKENKFVFNQIEEQYPDSIDFVLSKRFDGLSDIIQAIIELTPVTLPLVVDVINRNIDAKKNMSVTYNGIEIKGFSEKETINILNTIMNNK